jgi:hypothetical protein
MDEYTERSVIDYVQSVLASETLTYPVVTHGKYGEPFDDPSLSMQDIETIDYSRMISRFASVVLGNELLVQSISPILSRRDLELVIEGALFYETATRGDYVFEELKPGGNAVEAGSVDGEMSYVKDHEKDSLREDEDLFGQDGDVPGSPMRTGVAVEAANVVLGIGVASGVISIFQNLGDEKKTIATLARPPDQDGLPTIDELISERTRLHPRASLWWIKYYSTHVSNPDKPKALQFMRSIGVLVASLANPWVGLAAKILNASTAFEDPSVNSMATARLKKHIRDCADSSQVDSAYKKLVTSLATKMNNRIEKIPRVEVLYNRWGVPYGLWPNPLYDQINRLVAHAQQSFEGVDMPDLSVDQAAMENSVKYLLQYDPKSQAPRLVTDVTNVLVNADQLRKEMQNVVKGSGVTGAEYNALVNGLEARLWNKDSSMCLTSALEDAASNPSAATQAAAAVINREDRQIALSRFFQYAFTGWNIYMLYGAIVLPYNQKAIITAAIVTSYAEFAAGDMSKTEKNGGKNTELYKMIETTNRSKKGLQKAELEYAKEHDKARRPREYDLLSNEHFEAMDQHYTSIRNKAATYRQYFGNAMEKDQTSANTVLLDFTRSVATEVTHIRHSIDAIENRCIEMYEFWMRGKQFEASAGVPNARVWARNVPPRTGTGPGARRDAQPPRADRSRSPARTRGGTSGVVNACGKPMPTIDEIVDAFKARAALRDGTC